VTLGRAASALAALSLLLGAAGLLGACDSDAGAPDGAASTTRVDDTPVTVPIAAVLEPGAELARVAVGDECFDVLVADAAEERSRGLSEIDSLGDLAGMLFVWDADTESAFYMYRTRIPLDIGWYAVDGAPIGRAEMVPCPDPRPDDCPLYEPPGRYRYALELGSGSLPAGSLGGCA
jgi:uncharacterized membrane protein (UPF0127 family)